MEFKEINVLEGNIRQIGEKPFAGIAVDAGNGDYLYPNDNHDVLYENTLGDIETLLGQVPGFMKFLPKKLLIHDWPSWKGIGEINMERARFLLSTDEMSEKQTGKDKINNKLW